MKDLKALIYTSDEEAEGRVPAIFIVDGNPNGLLAAPSGSLAIDPATAALYIKTETTTTSWTAASDNIPGSLLDALPSGAGTVTTADLVLIEHDPSGTKVVQKLTIAQLKTAMGL